MLQCDRQESAKNSRSPSCGEWPKCRLSGLLGKAQHHYIAAPQKAEIPPITSIRRVKPETDLPWGRFSGQAARVAGAGYPKPESTGGLSSSTNACAACKSGASNPSLNQSRQSTTSWRASLLLSCCRHRRASRVAARSYGRCASISREMRIASSKLASARDGSGVGPARSSSAFVCSTPGK